MVTIVFINFNSEFIFNNFKNSTCKFLHSSLTFDYISSIYVCHQIYIEKIQLKKHEI